MKDEFKRQQWKEMGVGGVKCFCCRPTWANRRVDRRFNKLARTRLKELTKKIIKEL